MAAASEPAQRGARPTHAGGVRLGRRTAHVCEIPVPASRSPLRQLSVLAELFLRGWKRESGGADGRWEISQLRRK